jgi:hypothetical protein
MKQKNKVHPSPSNSGNKERRIGLALKTGRKALLPKPSSFYHHSHDIKTRVIYIYYSFTMCIHNNNETLYYVST